MPFQFHLVRLKRADGAAGAKGNTISIPPGPIEALPGASNYVKRAQFQFHLVRLKRYALLQRGYTVLYFNSTWSD